jgi:hypothetical protein
VAEALPCNARSDGISAVFQRFISRIDTVSGMEGLEMVCVALQEYTNEKYSRPILKDQDREYFE